MVSPEKSKSGNMSSYSRHENTLLECSSHPKTDGHLPFAAHVLFMWACPLDILHYSPGLFHHSSLTSALWSLSSLEDVYQSTWTLQKIKTFPLWIDAFSTNISPNLLFIFQFCFLFSDTVFTFLCSLFFYFALVLVLFLFKNNSLNL